MTLTTLDPNAHQSAYDSNGVIQVDGILATEEIDQIRTAFMQQLDRDRDSLGGRDGVAEDDILARYPRFMHPHRRPDLAVGQISRRLMTDPRILDVVTRLVGPAYGAQSMFYFKPPTARGQAMHPVSYTHLRAHET